MSCRAAARRWLRAAALAALACWHAPLWADGWRDWKGVLFQVAAPGQPANYILGSVHFGDAFELALDLDALRRKVEAMRVLVNEVDGTTPWQPRLDRYRLLDTGQSLPQLIGPQAFGQLTALLPGTDPAWLARAKPWTAMALLESRGERANADTLDQRIEAWAMARGMARRHLETLEEQLAALDCVPPAEHAAVLRQQLDTPWRYAEQAARALAYYRSGDLPGWLADIDRMEGLAGVARASEDRARRCLIEARNARWLPRLEPMLRRGGVFVAVGAIHLTGEAGLLEQLRRRGYRIAPDTR